jgi:hypothetical protein
MVVILEDLMVDFDFSSAFVRVIFLVGFVEKVGFDIFLNLSFLFLFSFFSCCLGIKKHVTSCFKICILIVNLQMLW